MSAKTGKGTDESTAHCGRVVDRSGQGERSLDAQIEEFLGSEAALQEFRHHGSPDPLEADQGDYLARKAAEHGLDYFVAYSHGASWVMVYGDLAALMGLVRCASEAGHRWLAVEINSLARDPFSAHSSSAYAGASFEEFCQQQSGLLASIGYSPFEVDTGGDFTDGFTDDEPIPALGAEIGTVGEAIGKAIGEAIGEDADNAGKEG